MVNGIIERDGHIHSPYCPHGSKDSFEDYINEAIKKGIKEITFTEHLPVPNNFMDEEFLETVAPTVGEIEKYFQELKILKEKYKNKIKINIGVEVDYLEGYEEFTKSLLERYGYLLDDSIISVHFIKFKEKYYCIDIIDGFEELFNDLGSLDKLYNIYFETVIKSIKSDLGKYKPKRVGHPSLVRIFNKKYPIEYKNYKLLDYLVEALKENNYEVDFNVAGLRKKFCGEIYPSGYLYRWLKDSNINMVYGSDSHEAKDLGSLYESNE